MTLEEMLKSEGVYDEFIMRVAERYRRRRIVDFYLQIEEESGPLDTKCWIWQGSLTRGYGVCGSGFSEFWAHRMSYVFAFGPIENGLHVRHMCHVRLCCNPTHLKLGTQQENNKDKTAAGRNRSLKGSESPNATINDEIAAEIKWLVLNSGLTNDLIVARYDVSEFVVVNMRRKSSWKHLLPVKPSWYQFTRRV